MISKNVVVLGGGTGLSSLLKGLKKIDNINLSAIVTVADDGGSTGVLRREFNLPAVGDLRKVILSLSSSENETLLEKIMDYRFLKKSTFLENHSLGNIILTALIEIENDFYLGVEKTKDLFHLKGEVIPVSNDYKMTLKAHYTDGSIGIGESIIPNYKKKIDFIEYLNNDYKTNSLAIDRLQNADIIVLSMGSLYTSLIANLIIPDIRNTILNNKKAQIIYVANVMTQNGETHDMNILDHVNAIEKHLHKNVINKVIINNSVINKDVLLKYEKENCFPCSITFNEEDVNFKIIKVDLLDEKSSYIRHDANKIYNIFNKIINE